jgi:hypothetical protein
MSKTAFNLDWDICLTRLVEEKIEEVLQRKSLLPKEPVSEVVPVSKAAPLLGYSSVRPIYQDIEDGLLRVGHEVQDRRRPGSTSSRYFINIPAAKKRLAMSPEERAQ